MSDKGKSSKNQDDTLLLRIVPPLGGLGEIGKNMLVLEYGDDMIIVDVGLMFPTSDMHGIDIIIPDAEYVLEQADKVRGIFLTHGHEDHTSGRCRT
ncbi:MAG: MBL fold metallo-hydrolase [Caldilineaceae bacterium]